MPVTCKDRVLQDIDPLNFALTKEKFGVTAIPPMARLANEFFNCWGKIKCSVTGQPLFSAETWGKKLKQFYMMYARDGYQIPPQYLCIHVKGQIKMDYLYIIAFVEQILLKGLFTIQSEEILHP